jgi:peptidoglycan/LPS O-acetylase OafA/YrhL
VHDLSNYLLNITLLSGFFNALKFTGIAQAWSLTAAEVFYLFTPLIFFFMKKKLANLIALILGFMLFGGFLVLVGHGFSNPNSFFGSLEFMFTYTFFGRCFEFIAGILVAIYYLRHKEKLVKQSTQYLAYLGLLGTVLCLALLAYFPENSDHFTIRFLLYAIILPIVGFAPLYIGLITSKTIISQLLSSEPLQVLGKGSYAFYLIHLGFIAKALQAIGGNHVFFFLLLNITAIALYYFVEKPLNKLIRSSLTPEKQHGKTI